MLGYISKMATKTTKEKCRYGERFLYFSYRCDACLLNSDLDEQAKYRSSNSLICPSSFVDLQEISGGSWSFVLRRCCWEWWNVNSFKIWSPKLSFSQVIFEEIWDVVRRFGSLFKICPNLTFKNHSPDNSCPLSFRSGGRFSSLLIGQWSWYLFLSHTFLCNSFSTMFYGLVRWYIIDVSDFW